MGCEKPHSEEYGRLHIPNALENRSGMDSAFFVSTDFCTGPLEMALPLFSENGPYTSKMQPSC